MEKLRYSLTRPNVINYLSTNSTEQRMIKGKHQHKKGNYTKETPQNLSFYGKTTGKGSQAHSTTINIKITGTNNHWSLISRNINGSNSPIKNRVNRMDM